MFRDLYRSRPHLGMIYVAMKSLRCPKFLWWKLPADPSAGSDERITVNKVPAAFKHQAYRQLYRNRECQQQNLTNNRGGAAARGDRREGRGPTKYDHDAAGTRSMTNGSA
jgi:hypothetical protein